MAIIGRQSFRKELTNNLDEKVEEKLTEQIFGGQVVEVLQLLGFQTWQEVYVRGKSIDIVANYKGIYIAIELKLLLNDDVLRQARENLLYCPFSIVVTPYKNRYSISEVKNYYAKSYGIGVYSVDCIEAITRLINNMDYLEGFSKVNKNYTEGKSNPLTKLMRLYSVNNIVHPKRARKQVLKIKDCLLEEQEDSKAGSKSGGVITPFKYSCILIKNYAQANKIASRKQIWTDIGKDLHWNSYNSMNSALSNLAHLQCVEEALDAIEKNKIENVTI